MASVQEDTGNYAFMSCILRVNVRSVGWQKIVTAVLGNIKGVTNFRMDEEGRIEVSGTVDPNLLLKILAKAGKGAELCWWQFGQCSSNLYIPQQQEERESYEYGGNGTYYGDDGYYDHYSSNSYNHGGGGLVYYGDERHLHYEGGVSRPKPKIKYQTYPEPPLANTSEEVNCCSVM